MIIPDALQVVIIGHARDASSGDYPRLRDYIETVGNSFIRQEANELVRELSLVDEHGTGASVRRFYVNGLSAPPTIPPDADEVDNALHTLVVVFISAGLLGDGNATARIGEIADRIQNSRGRHGFLLLGTSDEVLRPFQKAAFGAVKDIKGWSLELLGEYAIRPAFAALLALNHAHRLLSRDFDSPKNPNPARKARFFISHSKLDGLPLAHSLSHMIERIAWLDQFYDAKDIQSGDDFKEVLEHGVLESMLLILRTDIYDLRFWCRQEVMWAEGYDRPALLVDARTELFNRASVLGFTGIPGVRIPDGNLLRVLMEGLREWVRIGILRRRFIEACAVDPSLNAKAELLSRSPSLTSLSEAIRRLRGKASPGDPVRIVHAEPPLESNQQAASQALMQSFFPNGAVLSFKAFLAQLP